MIDLHSHVLAGVDDGPADLAGSVAIAQEATDNGVAILAATPHVRDDYPTTVKTMTDAVKAVGETLRRAGITVEVLPGAEIAFDRLPSLGRKKLRAFGLAGSESHVLVEVPYFGWPIDAVDQIRRLRDLGVTPVLAHPERNVLVQGAPERVLELVEEGAMVQVTAASLIGGFGKSARRAAHTLLGLDAVHLVASDTHRAGGRGAALGPALEALGDAALSRWLSVEVPAAIVEGAPHPPRPVRRTTGLRRRLM